jgi:hypothetical protein
MNEIKSLLNEEIKNEIQDLSTLQLGSEEKSRAIDDLTKLYKLRIEETKCELDYDEKYDRRIMEANKNRSEYELKEKQLTNEEVLKTRELDLKEGQTAADLEACDREEQLKRDQMKADVWDRYLKLGIEIIGIGLPLIFYASWMRRGFKFEETGTYTSTTFKGLFNRFKPTK